MSLPQMKRLISSCVNEINSCSEKGMYPARFSLSLKFDNDYKYNHLACRSLYFYNSNLPTDELKRCVDNLIISYLESTHKYLSLNRRKIKLIFYIYYYNSPTKIRDLASNEIVFSNNFKDGCVIVSCKLSLHLEISV